MELSLTDFVFAVLLGAFILVPAFAVISRSRAFQSAGAQKGPEL